MIRFCAKCGEGKAVSDFYKDKRCADGLKPDCKACVIAYNKARYHAHKGEWRARNRDWCSRNKSRLNAYHRRRYLENKKPGRGLGWAKRAKPILRALKFSNEQKSAIWFSEFGPMFLVVLLAFKAEQDRQNEAVRQARLEVARKKRREYERLKEFRRRGAGGKYTKADIDRLFLFQGGKCVSCRCRLRPGYHVDHILPIALGGTNDPHNLQLLCGGCNIKKGARHPVEYMQSLGRLL